MNELDEIPEHCICSCGEYDKVCCFDCPNYKECEDEGKCCKETILKLHKTRKECYGYIE
jgi:hypothetical protein